MLVMDRRSGAGEIVNAVEVDLEREVQDEPHKFEIRVRQQPLDGAAAAFQQIVDANKSMVRSNQSVAQMRSEEAASPVTKMRSVLEFRLSTRGRCRIESGSRRGPIPD